MAGCGCQRDISRCGLMLNSPVGTLLPLAVDDNLHMQSV